ncbi:MULTISPECIES: hypothetical protein [Rhizobium]|jgi:hypothetical protein|uniref:hypothetical protein n=1 Tax=Rhizobium TaxID=379 RepID=UPI001C9897D5|nr:hypothetical protein [Rhizobium leguminosarum]UWM82453.1 hypothetical protein N2A41_04035 [Rhizobium leguminosarum bv. viciae]
MIKPELAFAIIFMSNFAAPLVAFIAGRTWPRCGKTLHFLAVIWVVLPVYLCDRVTFTPDIIDVGDDSYDGLDQFIVVVAILLQQLAILATYLVWYLCSAFVKRQRASRREVRPFV